jgi:methionyl aminopeptidase
MIKLKSREEIDRMRAASAVVAEVLAVLRERVKPGVSTAELDTLAEQLTRRRGAVPAFKGYEVGGRVFPASVCISINDEVVHGIPSVDRVLHDGDIVGLDFGVSLEGYYGDAAATVPVGRVSDEAERLMSTTAAALQAGIEAARAGAHVGDISGAIQDVAEAGGYSLVREFVGHGIGRAMHEAPQVPNYGPPGKGLVLQPGMVIAIEPQVNLGCAGVRILDDGWTAVTLDGRWSAHFEHTVAVTPTGHEVLTRLPTA